MSHPDFQEYIEKEQPKKLLLLYHWDTDGLASAALFLNYIEQVSPQTEGVLMSPTINNYFLTEKELGKIRSFDSEVLVIVDINFDVTVIEQLEELVKEVFVFDHHSQTANIRRPGVQDTRYPGCSMMVNDYLMKPLSLVAILGMVGDQEDRIVENKEFYPPVQKMMKENSLTFDDVQRITKLVDTMYMVMDVEGLQYAIQLLRSDPMLAVHDERLLANKRKLQEVMKRECLKEMKDMGKNILYMPIQSEMSLISEVTRARAKEYPDKIIVTDQIRGADASLYVRRRDYDIDLGVVADLARSKGFNAGGKPEVVGVVLPSVSVPEFRKEVISLLHSRSETR